MLVDIAVARPMVENACFVDVHLANVATELRVRTPEALFDLFDGGAVRTASLLGRQPTARRDAIRADLAARTQADAIKHNGEYLVPAPSVVISAVRGAR